MATRVDSLQTQHSFDQNFEDCRPQSEDDNPTESSEFKERKRNCQFHHTSHDGVDQVMWPGAQ